MNSSKMLLSRYKDGYGVARGFIRFGDLIKLVGVVLGIIGLVISIAVMAQSGFSMMVGLMGLLISFGVGFILYSVGVMYSCFGQAMLALFDIAVNTSSLTPDDKLSVLGKDSKGKDSPTDEEQETVGEDGAVSMEGYMEEYGIVFENGKYVFNDKKYDTLQEAVTASIGESNKGK